MKLNIDKRWYYTGAVIILVISVFMIWRLSKDASTHMAVSATESSTESTITTELVQNALEHDYFYIRPKQQRRVIAIRELDESEIPAPFDFTSYGKQNYEDRHFYALVILDIDTDVRLNTETITEVAQLEILSKLEATGIEQTYKQLGILYEDDHAVYKHDKQVFVTSLIEPKLYKKYMIYDAMNLIIGKDDPMLDPSKIKVYETVYKKVYFSIQKKQFITIVDNDAQQQNDVFTFEGKTVLHQPSLTSVQGPSFSNITKEPRLNQFTLGASSAVVFERLGQPKTVDWLSGYYLNYEDMLIYSYMEEKGDALTFQPIHSVLYFGDYPVAGIQKGMTFKEVEAIIGPQSSLYFTELNEMTYPLSVGYVKDGFSISIGFDSDLKVSQFYIRSVEALENQSGSTSQMALPEQSEVVRTFSEDLFKVNGLQQFSDFATGFNSCYFNASAVTSDGGNSIDIGFYTYDLSRQAPTLISDQPMRMVFELLHDANPSVITIGKEDGILYKIDLNTYQVTVLSGPNYKHYRVRDGFVIKASLLDDEAFLEHYGLKSNETVGQFEVDVPKRWNVKYGDYPEGLYWSLANVFSKEIGLDLSELKGETVDTTVYRLESGLRAPDRNSTYEYPTNAVILRSDDQIKGAWLMFNTGSIGPSLEIKYLKDITGKPFENWVWDEGVFVLTTSYLPSPEATINAFFEAIQSGDQQKANACLTPSSFLISLTTNLDFSKGLYHSDFNTNNSLTFNILSATDVEIVSYYHNTTFKPIAYDPAYFDVMPIGARIGVEISLNLEWRDNMFNSDGKDTRFAVLEKTPFGWKLDGLGTGR